MRQRAAIAHRAQRLRVRVKSQGWRTSDRLAVWLLATSPLWVRRATSARRKSGQPHRYKGEGSAARRTRGWSYMSATSPNVDPPTICRSVRPFERTLHVPDNDKGGDTDTPRAKRVPATRRTAGASAKPPAPAATLSITAWLHPSAQSSGLALSRGPARRKTGLSRARRTSLRDTPPD